MLGVDGEESIELHYGQAPARDVASENDSAINIAVSVPQPARGFTSRRGKRNKPTLSCVACVARKSKCDRGRPVCLACYCRDTGCEYSKMANAIAATDDMRRRRRSQVTGPIEVVADLPRLASAPASSEWTFSQEPSPRHISHGDQLPPTPPHVSALPSETESSPVSFSPSLVHASYDRPALFTLFGMSRQHPFQNYWTTTGGLAEVVTVLPPKEQADLLVQLYFDIIDPVYPVVPRRLFMEEYRRFWIAPQEEKHLFDPARLALHFAIYATGMQYMDTQPADVRESTSELYLSSCHQSLCISSYLNHCSLATLQTMILICNFLIANHRVSDAWNFSGITQRQAYALHLHRDPLVACPDRPLWENQIRCRLWQATMFQDTSLSLYLELPPATILHDISLSCLQPLEEPLDQISASEDLHEPSSSSATDVSYLRAIWQYAQFAQEHMCMNKALRRSIASDAADKSQLISRFRDLYRNFDAPFNRHDASRFGNQPARVARQLISLSSNFFYALTILYMDRNEATGVECDVYGALDASHEAMASYFALSRLKPAQTNMWGAAQTRAYAQATMIATVLVAHAEPSDDGRRDPRLMLAKSNLERYIDILVRSRGSSDFDGICLARLADLQALRDRITIV